MQNVVTTLSSNITTDYLYTTFQQHCIYRQISNIRRTKFQNLHDSRLVLQLPLPNPLKPGGRLNKKDGLTRYGDSHVKDKTS